jgi:uncharacterized membrane protein
MDPVVRFWILIIAVTGTLLSTVALLVSSFMPGTILGRTSTITYVVSVFVALISMAVLVWSLAVDSSESAAERRPGR